MTHILGIGRQKHMRTQRRDIARCVATTRKYRARDAQLVMSNGIKNSQAGVCAIPREQNDFNVLPTRFIQAQQFARQFKSDTRLQQIIFMINLVTLIRLNAARLVHRMTFTQVKQRSR